MKIYQFKTQQEKLEDVADTVKTIEKVAASQIHFLKNTVANLDKFNISLVSTLQRLLEVNSNLTHPLLKRKKGKKAVIFVSGRKGLVGGMYHNLINLLIERQANYDTYLAIGEKGVSYLKEEKIDVTKEFEDIDITTSEGLQGLSSVTNYLFNAFLKEGISQVDVLYPKFVTLTQQDPTLITFLPFKFDLPSDNDEQDIQKMKAVGYPIFEPSSQATFNWLIQRYIAQFFLQIFYEAKLSEFSSRTASMEHASAKAQQMIRKEKKAYSKERQKFITTKQLESFIGHR